MREEPLPNCGAFRIEAIFEPGASPRVRRLRLRPSDAGVRRSSRRRSTPRVLKLPLSCFPVAAESRTGVLARSPFASGNLILTPEQRARYTRVTGVTSTMRRGLRPTPPLPSGWKRWLMRATNCPPIRRSSTCWGTTRSPRASWASRHWPRSSRTCGPHANRTSTLRIEPGFRTHTEHRPISPGVSAGRIGRRRPLVRLCRPTRGSESDVAAASTRFVWFCIIPLDRASRRRTGARTEG